MDRKVFLKQCGWACIGITLGGGLLASCTNHQAIVAVREGDFFTIPKSSFWSEENQKFKRYVIISNDELVFPICVFRKSETEYSALLMECSHQGAELQVYGDRLQCPAHGSEFDREGNPLNAPADKVLRKFQCLVSDHSIKISLR
jgi:nitrite reductase/ring-hydroxylating ferredoxin subunit